MGGFWNGEIWEILYMGAFLNREIFPFPKKKKSHLLCERAASENSELFGRAALSPPST